MILRQLLPVCFLVGFSSELHLDLAGHLPSGLLLDFVVALHLGPSDQSPSFLVFLAWEKLLAVLSWIPSSSGDVSSILPISFLLVEVFSVLYILLWFLILLLLFSFLSYIVSSSVHLSSRTS